MADQAPSSRTDDWAATLLDKLQQIGNIARAEGADGVIDGGDFFHNKSPGRNSHDLNRQVAEVQATYPCPTWANIGNHDVKYGSTEFLSESPLAVLFGAGVFRRLYDRHEATFVRDGVKVRVVGVPYHGTKYDMNRLTTITKGDEDKLIVAAHLLASPTGGTMFEAEDIVKYAELANLDPDVWMFGHWHKNQGVTEIAKGKFVVNIGSLSRGALTQDEMDRIPAVAVLKLTKTSTDIRQVPLKVAPAKEVFDTAGRARLEARTMSVDTLVDNLKQVMAPRETGSLRDEVRALSGVPEPVRERTLDYLEQAGT